MVYVACMLCVCDGGYAAVVAQPKRSPVFESEGAFKEAIMKADVVSVHKLWIMLSPPEVDVTKAREGKLGFTCQLGLGGFCQ